MKDLIVLVADKNMEFLMRGLLPRVSIIEHTREFSYDIIVHPYRDPGVLLESHDFLRPFTDKFSFAISMLDFSGCGQEEQSRNILEQQIENNLFRSGWNERACAIVIYPELENWLWVNEVRISEAISWENGRGIYEWLHNNGWKNADNPKPDHPKEAFEAILRLSNTPRSSAIYLDISSKASYQNCQDTAFHKLINRIKVWFS
jgi:hypothetical protein